jgi:hypothetical protein
MDATQIVQALESLYYDNSGLSKQNVELVEQEGHMRKVLIDLHEENISLQGSLRQQEDHFQAEHTKAMHQCEQLHAANKSQEVGCMSEEVREYI